MWRLLPFLLLAQPATAAIPGCYQLKPVPEVASLLELTADNRFRYMLTTGALDEQAQGRWRADGASARLTTEPKPAPPAFALLRTEDGEHLLDIVVEGPDGNGIAGIDVEIGFESGEPVTGYTQTYGWSLRGDEKRLPKQVRFGIPVFGFVSEPIPLPPVRGKLLRYRLSPNDLGTFAFADTLVEPTPDGVNLHRGDRPLEYRRVDCPGE